MKQLNQHKIADWCHQHPTYAATFIYTIILVVSFFPLFQGTATMNWDALDLWMPWKHFIVDELYNGNLPLWNPYFRDGFPQHGDTMTWYPISWFLGFLFGGYNLFSVNLEFLLHLLIAGTGMFSLSNRFSNNQKVNFLIGLSFMLSGFMIGNAQHVAWAISAAWMPWYFLALFQLYDKQNLKQLALFIVVGYFLFSGGYLAIFFVIVYLTLFLFVTFYLNRINKPFWRFSGFVFIGVIIIGILSLPILLSAYELFPLFNRFDPEKLQHGLDINLGATPWNGIISILFPFTSGIYNVPEFEFGTFSTFFGLIPFLLLLAKFKTIYINKKFLALFVLAVLFLMGSMGDVFPIRKLVSLLPLLDLFRYPTLFRLFYIFISLILLAMVLEKSPLKKSTPTKQIEGWSFGVISLLFLFVGTFLILNNGVSTIKEYVHFSFYLKPLEDLSFYQRLGLNLLILGTVFSCLTIWWARKKYLPFYRFIFVAWLLEIIMVAGTSAPHSVYYPINVKWTNHIIQSQPTKTPPTVPDHSEQEANKWKEYIGFSWKSKTFYVKQFSSLWYNPLHITPPKLEQGVLKMKTSDTTPFIGTLTTNKDGEYSVIKNEVIDFEFISNQHICINYPSTLKKGNVLFIKQKYVPDWKAFINNQPVEIKQSSEGFILIELDPTKGTRIEFKYDRFNYLLAFWVSSSCLFIILLFLLLYSRYKWEWSILLLFLFVVTLINNQHRFYSISNIELNKENSLDSFDFYSRNFYAVDFWKSKKDTVLVPQNVSKTDQEIAFIQHHLPVFHENIYVGEELFNVRSKGENNKPLVVLNNQHPSNTFHFDLYKLVEENGLHKKVLLLTFNYKSISDAEQRFWVAHKRDGEWINGKAWQLSTTSYLNSEKKLVGAIDISSFCLLPDDELSLYVWGGEDPLLQWTSFALYPVQ